jgi:phage-related protein
MNWKLCQVDSIVDDFLNSANDDIRDGYEQRAFLLAKFGSLCRPPISEKLRDGIFELRVRVGKEQIRFLYYFENPKSIVFVRIFYKKTRKCPPNEINKAIRIRTEIQAKRRTQNVSHYIRQA